MRLRTNILPKVQHPWPEAGAVRGQHPDVSSVMPLRTLQGTRCLLMSLNDDICLVL